MKSSRRRSSTAGCRRSRSARDADRRRKDRRATTYRQDVVTEISGDYTETLARLKSDPNTVGVFGLSFYEQNTDTLKVATVNGVVPTKATVAAGEYPVSRPLFFYVKGQHLGVIPGIEDYVAFFLSEAISGEGGTLEAAGLIPQPAETTAASSRPSKPARASKPSSRAAPPGAAPLHQRRGASNEYPDRCGPAARPAAGLPIRPAGPRAGRS